MKRWLPHPVLTPLLALLWLLLNNTAAPGHVVLGLGLGWAIPWFTLAFWPDAVRFHSPTAILRFAGFLVVDIVLSNLTVARLVLAGPRALKPALVQVPLDLTDEFAISLLSNLISLTPGTVSAQLSPDHKVLTLHALVGDDPETLVRTIKRHFEAPIKEIFGC